MARQKTLVPCVLAVLAVTSLARRADAQAASTPPTASPSDATPPGTPPASGAAASDAPPAQPRDAASNGDRARPRPPLVPEGGVPEILGPRAPAPRPLVPRTPPPPPAPPVPWPTYSVELQARLGLPLGSSFDDALAAHRYGGPSVAPTSYVGVAFPLPVEWLWLGGRLGVRGRVWSHPERNPASLVATDLLLTAQVRLWLGNVVELGILFAGGAGWMEVTVNGVGSNQVVGRFGLEGTLSFKVGSNFAFGPRIGWDYFQWEGMNAYGHVADAGGAVLALAFEGRE